jgi:hypothetical protein
VKQHWTKGLFDGMCGVAAPPFINPLLDEATIKSQMRKCRNSCFRGAISESTKPAVSVLVPTSLGTFERACTTSFSSDMKQTLST